MGWGTGRCRSTVASLGCWDTHVTPPAAGCPSLYRYLADIWPRTSSSERDGRTGTFFLPDQEDPTDHRLRFARVFSRVRGFSARKRRLSAHAPLAHAMQHSAMGTGWLTLWREDYMVFVYLLVAILGVGAAIFAVQNPDLVAVHFLSWRTVELPVSLIILLSAFVGIVAASISAFAQQIQLERRIRKLQRRLAELSASETSPPYIVRPAPFLSVRGTVTDTNQRRLFRECHPVLEAGAPEGQGGVRQGSPGLTDAAGRALAGARAGAQAPRGDRGHLRLRADRAR